MSLGQATSTHILGKILQIQNSGEGSASCLNRLPTISELKSIDSFSYCQIPFLQSVEKINNK